MMLQTNKLVFFQNSLTFVSKTRAYQSGTPEGEWNSTFFVFSLIKEGTTEKVLQFIMPLKSVYNKIFGFIEQKMYFERNSEVQTIKNLLMDNIFVMTIFFLMTFSELPL